MLFKRKKYERILRSKDDAMLILAHDIKSYLNVVSGFSNLTIDESKNDDIVRYAERIRSSVIKCVALVDEVIEWNMNASEQHKEYSPEIFNIIPEVLEISNGFDDFLENKKIKLEVKEHDAILVFADRFMIRSVLRNLISNAIKFTPRDGNIEMYFTNTEPDTFMCVNITNDYSGEIDTSKVFNLGFSTPGTDGEKGTGFGLPLIKQFIEKNGGEIFFKKNGSKVLIYFSLLRG